MIELIAKYKIKDYTDKSSPDVRREYGVLLGFVGICFNIFLFLIKIAAGIFTRSVAIIADAVNNLSDAGSSLMMMLGYRLSGHKADKDHPFGHGRIEYVTGLIISLVIVFFGIELLKSSIEKIISPSPVTFSIPALVILVISICVKLYMFYYNRSYSKRFNSQTMAATSFDSLSDTIATTVVLVAAIVSGYTGHMVDGWCGVVVSVFIIYTGITSAKDSADPLIGTKPSPDFVKNIAKFVMSYKDIYGIHDLIVHDYGAGHMMITLHAEVPADGDFVKLHDTIDNIEHKLRETLGCQAVIHMDPIFVNDDETMRMSRLCTLVVKSIDESLSIHDFRMVKGQTHTNLIFDVLVPFEMKLTDKEVADEIKEKISALPGNLFAVVEIDRPLV